MPIFKFTDSQTGKSISVTSDAVPTEEELTRLFEQEDRPSFTASPYGVGGGISYPPSTYNQLTETTAGYARNVVPVAAALATGGASLAAQAAAGGVAGAAGEMAARAVEGQDLTSRESLAETSRAALYNAIPVRRAAKMIENAASLGFGTALAESVGSLVGGQLLSEDPDVSGPAEQKAVETGLIASSIGAGFGALGRFAGKLSSVAQENAQKQEFLREIGITNPALSQVLPEYAPLTNRMAARDPELANKLASTESNITREVFDIIGDVPSNSEIASEIVPLMRKAEAAESTLKQAKLQQAQAKARLTSLEAAPSQSLAWQEEYEKAALEQLASARRQASATFAAQQGFGTNASIASHADDLTRTMIGLDSAVQDVSTALYSKTGLDAAKEIVSRDALYRSAKATLGNEANTPVGQGILEAIQNIGKVGDTAPQFLSWSQYKALRDEMSTKWANFNTSYKNRAESLAGSVYENLGKVFRSTVKDTLGAESLKAYDAAQTFWRNWAQTRDSNFTRDIFGAGRKTDRSGKVVVSGVTAEALAGLANDVLSGNTQGIRTITRAADLVKKYSPEAADSIRASVGRSIRGAMIDRFKNDPAGLVVALSEQVSKPEVVPFIQMAGFGTKRQLDQLAKVVRQYPKGEITQEVLDSALAAGDAVLGVGRGITQKKAKEAAALAVAGASQKANAKLQEARKVAAKANITADEALATYNETLNNPIFSVFTGRGKYGFTEEAGKTGRGTISDFVMTLSPDAGRQFMTELRRRNPKFAELASRKILADEMYRISGIERNARDATSKIDFDKLRRLFNPTLPQDIERAAHLRAVVGDTLNSRMKRFLANLEKASPTLKEAKLITQESAAPVVSTGLGFFQGLFNFFPGLSSLGAAVLGTRLGRIIEKPRFDLLTYMATDPGFVSFAMKTDKFSKAMREAPIQRSYAYMVNSALANDMADVDAVSTQGQPTR